MPDCNRLNRPSECAGDNAHISHNDAISDVGLSDHSDKNTLHVFFDFMRSIDVPADFMTERPMNVPPQTRGLFDNE